MPLSHRELDAILEEIRSVRIAVLGDFCLDAYWTLDENASEVSIETGLSTRPVSRQKYGPGGAGNVVSNLLALQAGSVACFGVLGDDLFGREMKRILHRAGADTDGLVVQDAEWDTPVYIKPIHDGTEERRIDFGNFNSLRQATADTLLSGLEAELSRCGAVVINQQLGHGMHTPYIRRALNALIARHAAKAFIVDSRHMANEYIGCLHKLNDKEAMRLLGTPRDFRDIISEHDATQAGIELNARWGKPVFITRGAEGCLVVDKSGAHAVPAIPSDEPIDTVGAGDSALAGITAALAAGRSTTTAAWFGNLVAAVTIRKLYQTGTASPAELQTLFNNNKLAHLH